VKYILREIPAMEFKRFNKRASETPSTKSSMKLKPRPTRRKTRKISS
jgi:hypothetical protein